MVDIIAAAQARIRIISLVSSAEERRDVAEALLTAGLPAGCVTFAYVPAATMWVRDYGPFSVIQPDGTVAFLDAAYTTVRANEIDDQVPEHLGRILATPVEPLPLTMEGGDLLSNGEGLSLSSQRLILRNEQERSYDLETTWSLVQDRFGFTDWIPLPSLVGEPTGHLDMFVTLLAPDLAVVGRYDPADDEENAARLDWVARTLAAKQWRGRPIRVERVTMPAHDDGQWRTFSAPISPTWSDAQAIAAGWWTPDTIGSPNYYTFVETLSVMDALTFSVSTVPADHPIGFDNASISCGLFADGFESGNTGAWSYAEGLSS